MTEAENLRIAWHQIPYYGQVEDAIGLRRDEAVARFGICTVVNVEGLLALNASTMFVMLHFDGFYVMVGALQTEARISEGIAQRLKKPDEAVAGAPPLSSAR